MCVPTHFSSRWINEHKLHLIESFQSNVIDWWCITGWIVINWSIKCFVRIQYGAIQCSVFNRMSQYHSMIYDWLLLSYLSLHFKIFLLNNIVFYITSCLHQFSILTTPKTIYFYSVNITEVFYPFIILLYFIFVSLHLVKFNFIWQWKC